MNRVVGMMQNVRNWPAYLLQKWKIARQKPFIIKANNGVSVVVPDRMMHTAKEVFFADDYQIKVLKTELKTANSLNVVDVGANVGYFSAFVLANFPNAKVISVEPIPTNVTLLKENQKRNIPTDWEIFEGVLTDKEGTVSINYDASDAYSTSASLYGLDKSSDLVEAESTSLELLASRYELESIDILKLDCEGAEYDILYCLSDEFLNKIQIITMETHSLDSDTKNHQSLTKWLENKGWIVSSSGSKILAKNKNYSND